ncbi:DUF536 domain-containing protein [Staphylococcus saprophyticus]|uniref:DUF536 domain-containing protein n=1 Tax=Staphylococcus saprophyticus TaxID=29385 RepID=UPI000853947A|nr:DUF536 domain-containing protein [Staphylococcus saprophyticus]MBU8681547.1 DUF536 domain-containing protein [Staphylococcus saprophyticus]MDW3803177.1 DUF536 domain-containing protein [Staphylococcus saprophyticus]MDW3978681.1 DUF536 domain-containing protein [Staphylococcus saprophyticus]MDW4041131.1 DUF536 domain-containing protein [Staphylococcus saprophyticus]MDW4367315.1 DUF536 domain-containing protein [Staphylococcus saprophyticus]
MRSVKALSEELEVSKQTIFNNIKRLNIETIKQENTSFIKEDSDIEKIVQRVNENKKKYGFENVAESKQKKDPDNIDVQSKTDAQIVEILKNQIDTLNNQIEKQESRHETTIEFYRKELQERSKLLENQQVLALESNKKIKKLEDQLEEERQLNYSFDTSSNDRQNVNAQEATFTEESKDNNQQQEENQTTDKDIDPKVIFEENRNEDINQSTNAKENERVEKQDPNTNDEVERPSKKGFWSRLFGN